MKTKLCLNDFFAVIAVVIIAVALVLLPMLFENSAEYVKIVTDEKEFVISLSQDDVITVTSNGYIATIEICDGTAEVVNSTCRDQICVHSGKISQSGDIIICAPARMSIEVIGKESNVDYAIG